MLGIFLAAISMILGVTIMAKKGQNIVIILLLHLLLLSRQGAQVSRM